MQQLNIKELLGNPIAAHGAMDYDERGSGISPRRLPAWTRMQTPQMMDVMVRMPSGVRLRFNTTSGRLGIEFLATNMVTPPAERRPIVFNLEVDGKLEHAHSTAGNCIILDRRNPGEFELERGEPDTVWFDLSGTTGEVEVWLPHNAFVELRNLHIDDDAAVKAPAPANKPRWVHYGSSISHCMEAVEPALTWPAVAARDSGLALQSFGFGGQCHLDQFVARTIRDIPSDLISIKTGINVINMDSMRERVFVPALHGFIDTIREGQATTPILLISPIYCPSAEHNPGPTIPDERGQFVTLPGHEEIREGCMTLTRVRELIAGVVEERRAAGDRELHYLDGLTLFGADDSDNLPDALHPNAEGYVRMGQRAADTLRSLLTPD
jgi:hypothetical protein